MKSFFCLFILFPFLSISQIQIGLDIDGEAAGDSFGRSVSLSSDGSILAIGAPLNDGNGVDSGHVRVYENSNGVWTQIGNDINGEAAGDISGSSVGLSSNGSVLAVGAPLNDGNGLDSGHVRIYENINSVWTQIGSDINGEADDDYSGNWVSMSSDGTIVAIDAFKNDANGNTSGHVRIYENNNNVWTQIGSDIDGDVASDFFGRTISLSSDGSVIAISGDINSNNSGYIRIYKNLNDVWTQVGSDIDGEAAGDSSGESVSLSSDGSVVAIGATFNDGNGSNSGHVRIYENIGDVWTQIGSDIDGEAINDLSGNYVSLSSDGLLVAIGAFRNGNDVGHVRIYKNSSGVWTQVGSDIDGEAAGDRSGFRLDLSSDGSTVAIGAYFNDGNGVDAGHVRVFDLSDALSTSEYNFLEFSIFPNPVNDQFTIQLESTTVLEMVIIYNQLGQKVLSSKQTTINTSSLASGTYLVEVLTNKGKATKKLIKE